MRLSRVSSSSFGQSPIRKVVVVLIKPTSYGDDHFLYRFARGVLPTNGLAAVYSLTKAALEELAGEGTKTEVHMLEDSVAGHARRLRRLQDRFPEEGTKLIVGLVSVQTAQFPRACDIIDSWKKRGAVCVIGGFHVSGAIATMLHGIKDARRPNVPSPHAMPEEIQALMDKGVVVFAGEAEDALPELLADILSSRQRSLYDMLRQLPDFSDAPLPEYAPAYFPGNFATELGTIDTSRGCPFTCSFCCIIQVQGTNSRWRSPERVLEHVAGMCERNGGKASFFLTDDNFARNRAWEDVLDGFIHLQEERDYKLSFMVEADLVCDKVKGFLDKLARAGCTSIFMGVESMNPLNLEGASKRQNKVQNYKALWEKCHRRGILVHAGYIIGFPNDTPKSIKEDVASLAEAGVDQVSFFMLTPIPGSEDHARAVAAGVWMEPDFNLYDSFHPLTKHPTMSREQWMRVFSEVWPQFYTVSNMVRILKRFPSRETRMKLLHSFIWYRWSFAVEGTHPMISGFYRVRDYKDRRPGAPPLSRWKFWLQELYRHLRYAGCFLGEFYRFQQVIFETECAPALAARRREASGRLRGLRDWIGRTFGPRMSRQWVNEFWKAYGRKRWQLLVNPLVWHWHLRLVPYVFTECVFTGRYVTTIGRLAVSRAK